MSGARRIQQLAPEAAELGRELGRLVAAIAPWLLELHGGGPVSAAQVLVSLVACRPAALRGRIRGPGWGSARFPRRQGQVTRHRLNRGWGPAGLVFGVRQHERTRTRQPRQRPQRAYPGTPVAGFASVRQLIDRPMRA